MYGFEVVHLLEADTNIHTFDEWGIKFQFCYYAYLLASNLLASVAKLSCKVYEEDGKLFVCCEDKRLFRGVISTFWWKFT